MYNFIIVVLINLFALFLVSNIMHGIVIHGWQTFIAASIVLSFINLLSLGFFTLIINAVILYCTSGIVKGFYVKDFFSAFWGALLLSIIYVILEICVIKRNVKVLRNNNEEREERNRINSAQVIDVEEIKDDKKD